MRTASQAARVVGPPNYKRQIVARNQNASDIVNALLKAARDSETDAEKLAPHFRASNPAQLQDLLHAWLRQNIGYYQEPATNQTAKTLRRILADQSGDCKHYATFSAAIAKAKGYPVYFRVIDQVGRFNHIYAVIKWKGREYVIDPCVSIPTQEARYNHKTDIPV